MLWRDLKVWQVYGANTDVGKTILSTILCKALARRASNNALLYLKPVSTGPQNEADDGHIRRHVSGVISKCISQYARPVSPHLAARDFADSQSAPTADRDILTKTKQVLNEHSQAGGRYAVLETAGGVLSPGPSGSLQADLYRPLRLPTLLMGDSKLGGIGTTISAFESLHVRGYDVESILLFDDPTWGNHEFLRDHFSKQDVKTFALPKPPPRQEHEQDDRAALSEYYEQCASSSVMDGVVDLLHQRHFSRTSKLTSMSLQAEEVIWHPFRQHRLPTNVIAIDSAHNDHFETYNPELDPSLNEVETPGLKPLTSQSPQPSLLTPLFDASASWWTQGLGHGNPDLSLTAAHAAGRYGHVMFANAVHEPALDLSHNLLATLQNSRLSRVFFTDNGSTGMEVAVKMALRAACQRYCWDKTDSPRPIGVLGLKGSYHGDTIGVMNCSEPCVFNEKVDWYRPWGYWFEPPEVKLRDGQWVVELPSEMEQSSSKTKEFASYSSIFDFASRQADAEFYKTYLTSTLTRLVHEQGLRFGALILEPLIMGAGGMILVDPLFQRTLITIIRGDPSLIAPEYNQSPSTANTAQGQHLDWSGLPFIADEVFTGLNRLGRPSSSSFLNSSTNTQNPDLDISPDISVHAKLLTGGLLPLALTTASNAIFQTFLSDSKSDALLHGHSYTAHPVGCSVANKSLAAMGKLHASDDWSRYKAAWSSTSTPSTSSTQTTLTPFSFFSPTFLANLSHHPSVSSCFAIGTVLALTLNSADKSSGYASSATTSLQSRLLTTLDDRGRGIHSRVLGDVIYFMTSLTTRPEEVKRLEEGVIRGLDGEIGRNQLH